MASITLTTASITNPSSGTKAYKGQSSAMPPASGADFSSLVELSTAEYTTVSTNDNAYISSLTSSSYSGFQIGFKLPAEVIAGTITSFAFGIKASGYDGYNLNGWNLYLRNYHNGTAWNFKTSSTSGALALLSSSISSTPYYYVDANNYIWIAAGQMYTFDSNGSLAYTHVDYAYLTITYTPAESTSGITQFLQMI